MSEYQPFSSLGWIDFSENYRQNVLSDSTQLQLPIKDLKKISLLYPSPKKQKLIEERLNTLNQKFQTEQDFLHKLHQIKEGLMNDLLSGQKKVDVKETFLT